MADLETVHLGLDENEADIAEELQDFDETFDTRSEVSESGSDSSLSQPSISSVSTAPSSIAEKRSSSSSKPAKGKETKDGGSTKKPAKRAASPNATLNGKSESKKKRSSGVSSDATKKADESKMKVNSASSGTATENSNNNKNKSSKEDMRKQRKKSTGGSSANGGTATPATTVHTDGGNKSDASDTEKKPNAPFESDSESENSDSEANHKRNGRKAASKSASPEKKTSSSSTTGTYDYMTKLNYLFRDTRFFLIKSNNADNVAIAKSKNVWATLPQNDANLNQAFKEARNVLLIYSVNESGKFAGFARMAAQSRRDLPQPAWVLPPSISAKALGGVIEIEWICRKELSFNCTSHLYNSWNDGKPVKIGRDGQEIEPDIGAKLCRLFPEDEKVELTPILRKSKETAKMMREKGIRVIYKPPRSLSTRGGRGGSNHGHSGGGGGGGGGYRHSSGGPMRHKRSFGGGPHRPYKMPPLGPPSGGFKRSSSPYRGPHGGPGSGSSRSGGGDAGLPPWERYMTTAAAAEAYVADYMRTMHGQLPPLPFVPPFAQLPLPGVSSSTPLPPGGPPSIYEQLPPPVRYYDGPPLPDYPPPQPLRPPPPGFDKAPSYEDFAAWKNAGLPTVPGGMPPGFPSFGNSNTSNGGSSAPSGSGSGGGGGFGSGGAGLSGGGSSSSGPNSYRNRDGSNANRSRERGGGGGGGGRTNTGGGTSRSGSDRDRHFRAGGGGGGNRSYRDSRR